MTIDGVPPLPQEALDAGRNRLRAGPVPPAGPDLQVLRSVTDRSRRWRIDSVGYRGSTAGSFSSPGLLWTPRIFSAIETIR